MSGLDGREGGPGGGEAFAGDLSGDAGVVRCAYRALEKGDLLALASCLDARVGWVDPLVSRLPFDGLRHGLPALLRGGFRRDLDGKGPRVEAGTFLELGDGVLVVGRLLFPGGEEPFMHECSMRDGRIVLIRGYP